MFNKIKSLFDIKAPKISEEEAQEMKDYLSTQESNEITVRPAELSELSKDILEISKEVYKDDKYINNPEEKIKAVQRYQESFTNKIINKINAVEGSEAFIFIESNSENYLNRDCKRSFELVLDDGAKVIVGIEYNSYIGAYALARDGDLEYVPKYRYYMKYSLPYKKEIFQQVKHEDSRQPQLEKVYEYEKEDYEQVSFRTDSMDILELPEGLPIKRGISVQQGKTTIVEELTSIEAKGKIQKLANDLYRKHKSFGVEDKKVSEIMIRHKALTLGKAYAETFEDSAQ